jgi:TPR repeat protein
MRELGRRCFNGYGVPKSYEDAFRWYLRAAEKGNWEAMHQLDVCYTYGWGVKVNEKQAEYWRAKADQARRIAFR